MKMPPAVLVRPVRDHRLRPSDTPRFFEAWIAASLFVSFKFYLAKYTLGIRSGRNTKKTFSREGGLSSDRRSYIPPSLAPITLESLITERKGRKRTNK